MAPSKWGIAYLDLDGNRVKWSPNDPQRTNVYLHGSHFHDIVPMATLAISALCLLSFMCILLAVCCVCCSRRHTSKFLPWATVWVPIFCLIAFFILDIANRVFHELQPTVTSGYIAIDIPLRSMASIADGVLMVYLFTHSPVDVKDAGFWPKLAMIFALVIYWLIGVFASRGTQIWNLVYQLSPSKGNGSENNDWLAPSVRINQDLDAAASGMQLLFAIGFALLSVVFIRHLSRTNTLRKRLAWGVAVLAAAFLVRNIVTFVFTLLYSRFDHIASLSVQLVYMAFYGLLSVVIYICIVLIAAAQQEEQPVTEGPRYGRVQQTTTNEGYGWQPGKPQVHVSSNANPNSYNAYPYSYEYGHSQR